jgi:putative Mg2+ transporter-C (MgtC) family protein
MVELSRVSLSEYQVICERLRKLDVVREFREVDAG